MDLTGRKKDYDNLAEIYDAQLSIQKDQLDVLLAEKNNLQVERDRIIRQLQNSSLSEQAKKELEKQLEAIDKAIEANGDSINANIEKQLNS